MWVEAGLDEERALANITTYSKYAVPLNRQSISPSHVIMCPSGQTGQVPFGVFWEIYILEFRRILNWTEMEKFTVNACTGTVKALNCWRIDISIYWDDLRGHWRTVLYPREKSQWCGSWWLSRRRGKWSSVGFSLPALMYGNGEANKKEVSYSSDLISRWCTKKAETSLVGSIAHTIHHPQSYLWKRIERKREKGKPLSSGQLGREAIEVRRWASSPV